MNKFNKSQALGLVIIALLLIIIPLLPSSLKLTYLYFIINLLIIALGVEAGLLSATPRPSSEDKRISASASASAIAIPEKKEASTSTGGNGSGFSELSEKKPKIVAEKFEKVKKCPSMVGVGEAEAEAQVMEEEEEVEEVEAEDEVGGINGQELFAKAEAFIGNFYKQLKMQRD